MRGRVAAKEKARVAGESRLAQAIKIRLQLNARLAEKVRIQASAHHVVQRKKKVMERKRGYHMLALF
jgi:hypothetical protein